MRASASNACQIVILYNSKASIDLITNKIRETIKETIENFDKQNALIPYIVIFRSSNWNNVYGHFLAKFNFWYKFFCRFYFLFTCNVNQTKRP